MTFWPAGSVPASFPPSCFTPPLWLARSAPYPKWWATCSAPPARPNVCSTCWRPRPRSPRRPPQPPCRRRRLAASRSSRCGFSILPALIARSWTILPCWSNRARRSPLWGRRAPVKPPFSNSCCDFTTPATAAFVSMVSTCGRPIRRRCARPSALCPRTRSYSPTRRRKTFATAGRTRTWRPCARPLKSPMPMISLTNCRLVSTVIWAKKACGFQAASASGSPSHGRY